MALKAADFPETMHMKPGTLIEVDWDTVDRDAGTVQFIRDGLCYTTLITTVLEHSEPTSGYPKA